MLKPDTVLYNLRVSGKKQALQKIAETMAETIGGDPVVIMEKLHEREKLGSTGMGNGVAIPHARLRSIDRVYTAVVTLDESIDFDSIDEKPVDIMVILLAPDGAGADHLQALAAASRLLRDQSICDKLRGADDADAVESILLNYEQAKAA